MIHYRPLNEPEIGEAADVFLTTLADLARRNGMAPPTAFTRETVEPLFAHTFKTGIFRVAEEEGRIVSICSAVVRDRLWFLSMFWTLPESQQKKVGGPLLRQVWDEGRRQGATIGFTWSSIDFTAMATYMRLGMLPGSQLFTFSGVPVKLPDTPPDYELDALEPTEGVRIDREVRGTGRPLDHAFFAAGSGRGFQVRNQGNVVGYFYVSRGAIGPAGWLEARDARAVIALALREAHAASPELRLMSSGANHSAIGIALECGLRLAGSAHLLLTEPFGSMDRYLPSGPALF